MIITIFILIVFMILEKSIINISTTFYITSEQYKIIYCNMGYG